MKKKRFGLIPWRSEMKMERSASISEASGKNPESSSNIPSHFFNKTEGSAFKFKLPQSIRSPPAREKSAPFSSRRAPGTLFPALDWQRRAPGELFLAPFW